MTTEEKKPATPEKAICQVCGEPMPEGEEMFNYHGYSGPCPKEKEPSKEEYAKMEKAMKEGWDAAKEALRDKSLTFKSPYSPHTPPETGKEREADFYERYELPEVASDAVLSDMKRFIRLAISYALAQGEKIGAEKERERLSGWLMHDDNCKGLYFDPKKTSKCDCGLADALKGEL